MPEHLEWHLRVHREAVCAGLRLDPPDRADLRIGEDGLRGAPVVGGVAQRQAVVGTLCVGKLARSCQPGVVSMPGLSTIEGPFGTRARWGSASRFVGLAGSRAPLAGARRHR
jgi:hypothetical protein